jgi:hypothetical protein
MVTLTIENKEGLKEIELPEGTYTLKLISSEHEDVQPQDTFNVFVRQDDVWEIRFNSNVFHIADCRGLRYIALLLMKQRDSIQCNQLFGHCQKLEEIDYYKQKDFSDTHADLQTINNIKKAIEGFREKLKEVKSIEEKEDLEENIIKLKKYLRDQKYQRKALTPEFKKLINSVTKCINEAIIKMKKKDQALAQHFTKSIEFGRYFSYSPQTETKWQVEI